jgi:hypothetical protein
VAGAVMCGNDTAGIYLPPATQTVPAAGKTSPLLMFPSIAFFGSLINILIS